MSIMSVIDVVLYSFVEALLSRWRHHDLYGAEGLVL